MASVYVIWGLGLVVILWVAFIMFVPKNFGSRKNKIPKRVRKDDAWTNGYKDMAYALLKKICGLSMQEEHYTVVNKQIVVKDHVFDVMIKHPEKIREFKPADGLTSPKYLGGSSEEWGQYREGGMKFLTDLDDYQGRVLARKASMLREDKRYTEAKKVIDEIREKGYTVSDEHEEFDRQFKELEG